MQMIYFGKSYAPQAFSLHFPMNQSNTGFMPSKSSLSGCHWTARTRSINA